MLHTITSFTSFNIEQHRACLIFTDKHVEVKSVAFHKLNHKAQLGAGAQLTVNQILTMYKIRAAGNLASEIREKQP
jgi:hypothetical protein